MNGCSLLWTSYRMTTQSSVAGRLGVTGAGRGRLAVSQRLEAGYILGELLVDGGLRARDRAHLQPDGLGPGRSGRRGRSILPIFCISISGMAFSTFAFF